MQGAQHPPGPLRFGAFELDLRARELRKRGIRVRLQEQPFQVLAMLATRPGEVVSRDELRNKLWPADTFVDFDHGLNKAVNKIRGALADSAETPRFVETVARRGYRFLAPVTGLDVPVGPIAEGPSSRPRVPSLVWQISTITLALLAGVLVVRNLRPRPPVLPQINSVAVLPLESLSADASQDYFADGMTDELITDLGQIAALRVISRTSVMSYKRTRKPLPQIGRELGVDAVVEGTVLRSGDQVRITAQLIRVATDQHLWAQSYIGNMRDALGLQTKVARSIAEQISIRLTPEEEAVLTAKPVDPEAYESYLEGRYFWNKRTGDGLLRALQYFNKALAKDPNYAKAYAGLADSYALLGNSDFALLSPREAYPKAKAAATRALQLDSSLGEAHASLAFCLGLFEWNWDAAEKEYRRAIALNPGYATAHQWYALQLSVLGRSDQSIEEIRRAEKLDPLSLIISADVADVLFAARRYDESMEQSHKTIDMDPTFAIGHYELGQTLVQKKMYAEAIAELRKAKDLSGGDATCTAVLAYAYAAAGRKPEALRLLTELKRLSNRRFSYAAQEALIYASLNDNNRALALLDQAYRLRFDALLLRSPAFDSLRADPQFRDLMRRIGLS
jgi:TolB-like protein/DNA-binding winged helix-turn-helix (wHTH) protein/Tfp pilus assembly protein PilF